jgi:hypothetical protein
VVAVTAREIREDRAILRFASSKRLRAGSYVLLLTLTDADGISAVRRKRVRLG